jgi:mannobiose 2-epimerase
MDSAQLKDVSRQIRDHLFDQILPFWCGPALDWKRGGWLAALSNDVRPDRSQLKELVLNSQLLWTFSAVHRVKPAGMYREMADRALNVLLNDFWDREHGGAFWSVSADGTVVDDSKRTNGQVLCIYALTEYYLAFALPVGQVRAKEIFDRLQQHAHDDLNGGYWEVRRRDWSESADSRLSVKDMNETKSLNTHLYVLEAYGNLYRIWHDRQVEEALRELIDLFAERIVDDSTWHLQRFFSDAWDVRFSSHIFGQGIEASWLLCEAAAALMDSDLIESTQAVALQMAAAALEGLDVDGGLCHEGRPGRIIDRRKEWWSQAEALIGFVNAFEISGEEQYLEAACSVWSYIHRHLVDSLHGEWYWRTNEDGYPDASLPKVSQRKDPLHATRACLQAWKRLERIGRGEIQSTATVK